MIRHGVIVRLVYSLLKHGVYIDERANQEQQTPLGGILSGEIWGPMERWMDQTSDLPCRVNALLRALPQNCHSEERSDEESGAGLLSVSLNPPPQTSRCTRGDMPWRLLRQSRC